MDERDIEWEYIVYRYEDEGCAIESLVFVRREFIKWPERPDEDHILAVLNNTVEHYPAARYRAVPADTYLDFTVRSEAVKA